MPANDSKANCVITIMIVTILMQQIFDVTANENTPSKRNELE